MATKEKKLVSAFQEKVSCPTQGYPMTNFALIKFEMAAILFFFLIISEILHDS